MERWLAVIVFSVASVAAGAPHKVRVSDPAEAAALVARGGKVLADYGSFRVIETDEAATAGNRRAQPADDSDVIELNARPLNTRAVEVRALRKRAGAFAGRKMHLVQFVGPIKPEWRAALEQTGVRVVSYIPQNAYLVRGDATALGQLQTWADAHDFVQWDGDYADDYKIHPRARITNASGQPQTPVTDTFAVQLVDDAEANAATLALIDQIKLAPVQRESRTLNYLNLIVRLPVSRLEEIAARPEVISIQPYIEPRARDERQDQIIAGNVTGNGPSGPGYLAWLASKGFTQAQFSASGFAVDVTDSGLDNGTTSPGHFGLYLTGDPAAGSRVIYNRLEGTAHSGSTLQGCDGHGTLNSHIIAGYNNQPNGFPHTDAAGFHYGLGVCPFVKIGSSVIFDPSSFTSPNYANLQSKAYQDGARISANSWGADSAGAYNVDSQSYDALVRDAQPSGSTFATAGNQPMVIVFAAGNAGSGAQTVGSPGTGKNVITVGAAENVHSHSTANGGNDPGGSDGCGFTDAGADNLNDIASFSSRGPCSDGRMKPDLVAPGTHITGGVAQTSTNTSGTGSAIACFNGTGVCRLPGGGTAGSGNNFFPLGQQFFTTSSGTSHSTPAVAGACALLRQYFLNSGSNAPSPAMTKAFLMNGTRYLTGVSANDNLWSAHQGMGELNLGRAFDGVPRVLRDQTALDKFTATGQTRTFTGTIPDSTKPFRVTLAWTDAPGSTTGNAFNNDLDLTVTVNGVTYKGNVFSGAFSAAGGVSDNKNNVESVLLPAGVSNVFTVTVTAANINSDGVPNEAPSLDQDFALVIYNAVAAPIPVITPGGYGVAAEGCFPTNGAVDPGETMTVNFGLKNVGAGDTAHLVATLLATNGVLAPSAPQDYGALTAGGATVNRAFTFTAIGSCGGTINPVFSLQDGSTNYGTVSLSVPLGLMLVATNGSTNASAITIPDSGKGTPYPSAIAVAGLAGAVTRVSVTLRGLSHTYPDDLDVLLVGPAGQTVLLMSDCGGSADINNVTLVFDDSAAASLPNSSQISSGTYKPTNFDTSSDTFPTNAPAGPYGSVLAAFNGVNPNGNWMLYLRDDSSSDAGSLAQGWTLSITTSNLSCCNSAANAADVAVLAVASPLALNVGSNVTFTFTITNRGPDPAGLVTVSNALPAALRLVSAISTRGSCTNQGNVITCALGLLTNGAAAIVTVQAVATNAGMVTNQMFVGSGTADPVAGNNVAATVLFVNSAPMISAVADQATDEDMTTGPIPFTLADAETNPSALLLAASSTDTNLVPAGNILFGGSGSNRTVTVTPALNQSGTATITLTVNDGLATASSAFLLTVHPANDPPVLAGYSNYTILEDETIVVPAAASDPDLPPNLLTFAFGGSAPLGAEIGATNGVFKWTPAETQGGTTNIIVVVVTDNGVPSLSATQAFTVTVLEENARPLLAAIPDRVLFEGATLRFTNSATDSDLPTNTLVFSLAGVPAPPSGATIDPASGVFAWTPDEAQGPGTNVISVVVTDNGLPSLSATQTFTVIVLETNSAPMLAPITNYTIVEHELLTFTNLATDSDLPTNTLTFSLVGGPTNATINPTNGEFAWTPDETQGPGTNEITVIVTDDGVPSLSATQTFTVIVLETNSPPMLTAISNYTVTEGELLAFTNTATDSDLPANTLVFSLVNAPTNATIDPVSGGFAWTPDEAQGPGTNEITVVVTDDGEPSLSATQMFTVIVLETNSGPVLAAISNYTIVEGSLLTFTNTATDNDLPANQLLFSLAIAPTNATLNPTNGLFAWIPDSAADLGAHELSVVVTDDGEPSLSATQNFTVLVLASNHAPVLAGIADRIVHAGSVVVVTNAVTDADEPANVLTFSLDPGAPPTAGVNPTNGLLTWATSDADVNTTNQFTVRVTDNGLPNLADTKTFAVAVVARPMIETIVVTNDVVALTWSAIAGQMYRLQFKLSFDDTNWLDLPPDVTAAGPAATHTHPASPDAQRFYRVMLLP